MSEYSIEELRTFVTLSETGSVTDTAKRLGVRQPAASRRLDKFIGGQTPLLRRRNNALQLTDRGRVTLAAARSLVQQYDQFARYVRGGEARPQCLTVAAGANSSQCYLAPTLARLPEQLSDWTVRIRVIRGEERIIGVAEGNYDLAIVSHDPLQIRSIVRWACGPDYEVNILPLATDSLCAVTAKDSRFAEDFSAILKGHAVPLERLASWDLVGLDTQSGIRRQLESHMAGCSAKLRFTVEAGGWLAAKEYAKQGVGVAILPIALLGREDADSLLVRRLSGELRIHHQILTRADDTRTVVSEVQSCLVAVAKEQFEQTSRRWKGIL